MTVRIIQPDELVAWVDTTHVPFLQAGSAAEEAEFRRTRIDFNRTWGSFDGQRMVGTLRSFDTQLTVPGGAQLAVDAVTNVAVHPTHRRRGVMSGLIQTALAKAVERAESASILIAAEYPIYGRFGYGPATEHATYTLDVRRTAIAGDVDGRIDVVAPDVMRQVAPGFFERFRGQQPGAIGRREDRWDVDLGLIDAPYGPRWKGFCALYRDPADDIQGLVQYHVDAHWEDRLPRHKIMVDELLSLTPAAYTGLWRFLTELDLVASITAEDRPVDEVLYWQLGDGRAMRQVLRSDFLWLRLLDLGPALSQRRYAVAGRVVIEVVDALGYTNGRFVLEGGPDGATCRATTESADASLGIGALSAAYLGGSSLTVMHRAGLIDEQRPGAVARLDALFATRPAPWCNTWF